MLSRPAAPDDAIRRRRFHFDVVGWWPGRCGGVCQRLKIAAAPLSELEDHSALNLHRKGVRDSHVCASRARARRSRLAAQLAWPAELRGRGRRPPDRDSMMVAFGRVLALDFGLARWCSLSLGAWLPSAAPDDGNAGAADSIFDVVGWWPAAGARGVLSILRILEDRQSLRPSSELEDHSALNLHRKGVRDSHVCASRARARRSRLAAQLAWPAELRGRGRRPPDRDSMMVAFGRVLALDFGLARWCSLSLGAWLPSAAPDQ